jgi:hypothetical protein
MKGVDGSESRKIEIVMQQQRQIIGEENKKYIKQQNKGSTGQ